VNEVEGRKSKVEGARRLGVVAALALAVGFALIQKWPEAEPEPYGRAFARVGPQVGERLPDFTLPDTTGRMRTLPDLVGPRGLVLVFNQSADW
jgi:hypothetical protein